VQRRPSIGGRPEFIVRAVPETRLRAGPEAGFVVTWHDRVVRKTVLIVDDHSGFRAWTRSLLEAEGFVVLGETADGTSAIAAARDLRPDLVLLDVMLPDMTGFAVAEQLATLSHPPDVVLVSSREASDFGPRIHRAAARGFISKPDLTGDRLRALLGGV
jgi:DNA-binding NarL/FixJ family response regulator